MTKYIPCRVCATKPGPKPGFYFISYKNTSQKGVVECECHKKYVMRETLRCKAQDANIWTDAFDYNIDTDYIGTKSLKEVSRLKKYVTNFSKYSDAIVYLHGPNGTQKTTLAQWIGASVLCQGYSVKYLLMQTLLMTLSGFERSEEKQQEKQIEIEKLKDTDLLIIDESFSKDKVTIYESGYQLPFLDRFLRERCEIKKKGMVFISNKPPSDIEKQKFSLSLQDFIIRNTSKITGSTCLYFEDNYMQTKSVFDPGSLFD